MTTLSLALLGPFQAVIADRVVHTFRTNKVQALLIYLTVEAGQTHTREALMSLLWPEMAQEAAQDNLRQTLYLLRKLIPLLKQRDRPGTVPFLLAGRKSVQVNPDCAFWLDCRDFDAGIGPNEGAARRTAAAHLYRGDFLSDFYLPDSDTFEEWVSGKRAHYQRLALEALESLTLAGLRAGAYEEAEAHARRRLAIDNLQETAHQQLMEALVRCGKGTAALEHYAMWRRLALEELDDEPSRATEALRERIQASLTAPKLALPSQPTPFVGRQIELAQVTALLADSESRLLTIVGIGGAGKTRLALRVAEGCPHLFLNGVFFVACASLEVTDSIATAVAESLALALKGAPSPEEQVLEYLRTKELLVVLDNFEHLVGQTRSITRLLEGAPRVKVLVTSRVRLDSTWETVFELGGLDVPEAEVGLRPEVYSAVQLFIQSARRRQSDFALTERDAVAIARICRVLSGLPLAIELAAAWIRIMSCTEIAHESERGLDLLVTAAPDLPPRHQDLRATFESSWQLLQVEEQTAFAALSVFRGGFSRAAAEIVARVSFHTLARLLDHSLIQQVSPNYFAIHELLRQYAGEKLQQAPEEARGSTRRHMLHYAELLRTKEASLQGGGQQAALAAIGLDLENIRAAWKTLSVHGLSQAQDAALHPLFLFYDLRGWFHEGAQRFEQALTALDAAGERSGKLLKARISARLARFYARLSQHPRAKSLLEESLGIFNELNVEREQAFALHYLGEIAWRTGEYDRAMSYLRQSIHLYERALDGAAEELPAWAESGLGNSLNNLGIILHDLGAYTEAEAYCQRSLRLYRRLQDQWGMAAALNNLGLIAVQEHEPLLARHYYEESLALNRTLGRKTSIAIVTANLGELAVSAGEYEQARRYFSEGLKISREENFPSVTIFVLIQLGMISRLEEDFNEAATYYLEALDLAFEKQTLPSIMEALLELAALATEAADARTGIETLMFVRDHQASKVETRERAVGRLAAPSATMPAAELAAAETTARQLTLDQLRERFIAMRLKQR